MCSTQRQKMLHKIFKLNDKTFIRDWERQLRLKYPFNWPCRNLKRTKVATYTNQSNAANVFDYKTSNRVERFLNFKVRGSASHAGKNTYGDKILFDTVFIVWRIHVPINLILDLLRWFHVITLIISQVFVTRASADDCGVGVARQHPPFHIKCYGFLSILLNAWIHHFAYLITTIAILLLSQCHSQ